MTSVSWGISPAAEGREGGRRAAQQALNRLGSYRPDFALIFVSHGIAFDQVFDGAAGVLGKIPSWGCSVSSIITPEGESSHSVVVGLVSVNGSKTNCAAWGQPLESSESTIQAAQWLKSQCWENGLLLMASDGLTDSATQICAGLTGLLGPVTGCLAGLAPAAEVTWQAAGGQVFSEGMACMAINGGIIAGVGNAHGWLDSGLSFLVSGVQENYIHSLDGIPAIEYLGKMFGNSPDGWKTPPLSELARLYALGFETTPGSQELMVRSPVRVEQDGRLRLNLPVPEGQSARLLLATKDSCLEAAAVAVKAALDSIVNARPMLAMVFIDQAWQLLFKPDTQSILKLLNQQLHGIPLIGGYTLGQIARNDHDGFVRVYNQNITIAVLAEAGSAPAG